MILVKNSKKVITFSGHAEFSDSLDIVCASVSSIMYTTVNAIKRFNNDAIDYKDNGDVVSIIINSDDSVTETLIYNMLSLLLELSTKYPKNLKIESEE